MSDPKPYFEIEDINEFASKLSEVVCKLTGLNHVIFDVEIVREDNRRVARGDFLKVRSHELVNYVYPKMFKSITITEFGGNWSHPAHVYWLPLHYSYEHFTGGHNGSSICYLMIDNKGNIKEIRNELKERE